jgi:hypothetical protein
MRRVRATFTVEINHADGPDGIEQNVVRVQIRVIDSLAMQPRDGCADGAPYGRGKGAAVECLAQW